MEVRGSLLYVMSVLLFGTYGFSRKRAVFWFALFLVLWLFALSVSGFEYINQPRIRDHGDATARAFRTIRYVAMYLCVVWQFYVVWLRPRRRLQGKYDRVIRKLFVLGEGTSPGGARHPIDKALDLFVQLRESKSVSDEVIASVGDELHEHRERLASEKRSIRRTIASGNVILEARRRRSRAV